MAPHLSTGGSPREYKPAMGPALHRGSQQPGLPPFMGHNGPRNNNLLVPFYTLKNSTKPELTHHKTQLEAEGSVQIRLRD